MRLEPVFLVAPRPNPPSMTTRRAFLLAGGTFAVGAAVGGACGYSIGAKAEASAADGNQELAPSGDVELDELRRLAVKAPISELVSQGVQFAYRRDTSYRTDEVLWKGISRLAHAAVDSPETIERGLLLVVIATIERGSPPSVLNLESLLPALRKLRSTKR